MLKVVKPSEIDSVIGTEIGVSDWVTTVSYTHLTLPTILLV